MRLLMMLIPFAALAALATCAPFPAASGERLFARNCAACHGPDGTGQGPQADKLPRAPADLTRISARNGGVFPIEDVMIAIYGYRGQHVHALMPEFGSVLDGATVIWVDQAGQEIRTPVALLELARYLETLQVD